MSINISLFWSHVLNLFILVIFLHNFNWVIDSFIKLRFNILHKVLEKKIWFEENFQKFKSRHKNFVLQKIELYQKIVIKIARVSKFIQDQIIRVFHLKR